jgi:Flp pilus assembly protein TadD
MPVRLATQLVAALALFACAGSQHFVCPARQGPSWRELKSDHFVLQTDLDPAAAASVLEQLETLRAVLQAGMFNRPVSVPERLEVVAFASLPEFAEVTHRADLYGYFSRDALGGKRMVLGGGLGSIQGAVVAHELTHLLPHHFLVRQPRWFSEGIATYYQTAAEKVGKRRRLGTLPGRSLLPLSRGPLPVKQVLAWRKVEDEEARYYATSWLLVHYLMNARLADFAAYQRRLARMEEPQVAWNATFPEWSLEAPNASEALDELLRGHLHSTTWQFTEIEAPATAGRAVERILTPSEVHAITLDVGSKRPEAELLAEAREALAEDPGHVRALEVLAARKPARAPALARRAVASHADDPQAWAFLAQATHSPGAGARREEARRRAVELEPERPEWRVGLAMELLADGRAAEAEAEAGRAVRAAPWSWAALFIDGVALVSQGRCPEGVQALHRAVDVMAENLTPQEVARNADAYDRLAQRCADANLRAADMLAARAGLLLDQREDARAARLLREAVARDPHHAEAWEALGLAEVRLGHLAEGTRALRRQLEVAPSQASARLGLGAAQALSHRLEEAEASLRKVLESPSAPGWVRRQLVHVLLERARPGDAMAELDRAPPGQEDAEAWFLRGRAHLLLGDAARGARELERALKGSADPGMLDGAARALAEAGASLAQATTWAERARAERLELAGDVLADAIGPEQSSAAADLVASWVTAGLLALRRGSLAEAERLLAAGERLGADPRASGWLAEALDRSVRPREAARARARADAVAPELRDARQGPDGDVAARARAGQADLLQVRSLPLPVGAPDPGRLDLLLALGADGTVAQIVSRDGEQLPDGVAALRGAAHGIALPPDAPALLVVAATTACEASRCAVVLGTPLPDPAPASP